jgi:hypothetical protein
LVFTPTALAETLLYYLRSVFSASGSSWTAWAIGLPIAGLTLYDAAKGRLNALFGWAWFVLALAPFLPLAHHLSNYYLFFPSAGLAFAVASVTVRHGNAHWPARVAAAAALALWVAVSVPAARRETESNHAQSIRARDLVSRLAAARTQGPNKTLLLTGVDEGLFNASIGQQMLPVTGLYNVYLAPGPFAPEAFTLSARETRRGLLRDSVVVYDASQPEIRDVTAEYRQTLAP